MSTSDVTSLNTVGFDKLAETYPTKGMGAASSALKGSLEVQEMVQKDIARMMRDITPHLGQQIDISA